MVEKELFHLPALDIHLRVLEIEPGWVVHKASNTLPTRLSGLRASLAMTVLAVGTIHPLKPPPEPCHASTINPSDPAGQLCCIRRSQYLYIFSCSCFQPSWHLALGVGYTRQGVFLD